jgi:hypothetical protein
MLDADALLGTDKVRDPLEPAVRASPFPPLPPKGIEQHHLLPRSYLRTTLGVMVTRQINQIANMAFVNGATTSRSLQAAGCVLT